MYVIYIHLNFLFNHQCIENLFRYNSRTEIKERILLNYQGNISIINLLLKARVQMYLIFYILCTYICIYFLKCESICANTIASMYVVCTLVLNSICVELNVDFIENKINE